jgi:hypothetical protein
MVYAGLDHGSLFRVMKLRSNLAEICLNSLKAAALSTRSK